MVKMERVSDYVLRPLAQDEALARCGTPRQAMEEMMGGALYNLSAAERTTLDEAAFDLVAGWCLLFFPGESAVLSLFVGTEEKRSISSPSNETVLKGSRDAFVESLRTNTSIVRRHLKTPELRIREQVVGRQSVTSVDILYIEGLTNPHLVEQVAAQLADIDIDAVLATGNIEEYIVPAARTAFPLVQYTERSDRFCAGLAEGGWASSSTACPGLPGPRRAGGFPPGAPGQERELAAGLRPHPAALPVHAGHPASARPLCGHGHLPPGDDSHPPGPVHHCRQAGRTLPLRL